MKEPSILFREVSRPPRLLTWPLVLIGAGAVATAPGRSMGESEQGVFAVIVFTGALCTLLLLEFVAVVVEVTETEVRFSVFPFYLRRAPVANIEHCEVHTYLCSNNTLTHRSYWIPPRHCVELIMKDGSPLTLMLEHPEWLSSAIGKAKRMAASGMAN